MTYAAGGRMTGNQKINAATLIALGEKAIRPDQSVYQFTTRGWVYIGEGWDVFISDDNYAENEDDNG
jgi:hypothetical protein